MTVGRNQPKVIPIKNSASRNGRNYSLYSKSFKIALLQ